MSHTEREIFSQPDVWGKALEMLHLDATAASWNSAAPASVVVVGCGSTFYLSQAVAALLREYAGVEARATPSSELILSPTIVVPEPESTILLAVSRSGSTSETLAAVNRFRVSGGGPVYAITNYPDSPLAAMADVILAAPHGQEESVAQTRSFTSMLLLAEAFVASVAGLDSEPLNSLPRVAADVLAAARESLPALATDPTLSRFFFLGSDPLYGVAAEGMLKLKEMSLTDSEAFHTLEFRHGPMSMADPAALVIGLVGDRRAAMERAVVADAAEFGARTFEIGPGLDIDIPESLPGWARPALYLLPLQVLALERARHKGLDPDNPRNLVAVIQLGDIGATVPE